MEREINRTALTFDDINIVPRFSDLGSRTEACTATHFLGIQMSSPVVPSNMRTITGARMARTMDELGGIGIIHRFGDWVDQCQACENTRTTYALSVGTTTLDRSLEEIYKWDLNPAYFVIDVAHGDSQMTVDAIQTLKEHFPKKFVVAGNIATRAGARTLIEAGADALKVGIGNGSVCETRIRTGVGIPQATALMDVVDVVDSYKDRLIQVISDGGVKTPGDVAKAIALGADLVMTGSLFAGTKETPGALKRVGIWPNEQLYKEYAGSASIANGSTANVEGNSTLVQYKGHAERIYKDIQTGLRSSMSYVGARTIPEFQARAKFVRVTSSGQLEAQPYLLLK